jgi:hypothetical protein
VTVFGRFELPGVVRVSLGIENSEADVDTFIRVLGDIARRPKDGNREKRVRAQVAELCESVDRSVYFRTDAQTVSGSGARWRHLQAP